jgi:hypothetical protein
MEGAGFKGVAMLAWHLGRRGHHGSPIQRVRSIGNELRAVNSRMRRDDVCMHVRLASTYLIAAQQSSCDGTRARLYARTLQLYTSACDRRDALAVGTLEAMQLRDLDDLLEELWFELLAAGPANCLLQPDTARLPRKPVLESTRVRFRDADDSLRLVRSGSAHIPVSVWRYS